MTEKQGRMRKSYAYGEARLSRGELLFCLMSALSLVLGFLFADTALSAMAEGMRLCVSVVIPSLFFFTALSDMLVSSGGAALLALPFRRVCRWLFGVSDRGAEAVVLGAIFGFPIGARCALSLYSEGRISRREAEHLLCFCNGPSAAFLINAVGLSLFSSRRFGVLLYISSLLASACVGICMRWSFGGDLQLGESAEPPKARQRGRRGRVSERAVRAVTDAAESMLAICAFVIFFSALTGVFRALLERVGVEGAASALALGIFEMTGGVCAAASLALPYSAIFVAAIVGWSGLSVHFQMIAFCKDSELSFAPYFAAKLLGAAFCAVFVAVGIRLFGGSLGISQGAFSSFALLPEITPAHTLSLAVILLGIAEKRRKIKKVAQSRSQGAKREIRP